MEKSQQRKSQQLSSSRTYGDQSKKDAVKNIYFVCAEKNLAKYMRVLKKQNMYD